MFVGIQVRVEMNELISVINTVHTKLISHKEMKDIIKQWRREMSRQSHEGDIKMANKHMKRYSLSQRNENQNNKVSSHLTPV